MPELQKSPPRPCHSPVPSLQREHTAAETNPSSKVGGGQKLGPPGRPCGAKGRTRGQNQHSCLSVMVGSKRSGFLSSQIHWDPRQTGQPLQACCWAESRLLPALTAQKRRERSHRVMLIYSIHGSRCWFLEDERYAMLC